VNSTPSAPIQTTKATLTSNNDGEPRSASTPPIAPTVSTRIRNHQPRGVSMG
jgi:hypothetical protein